MNLDGLDIYKNDSKESDKQEEEIDKVEHIEKQNEPMKKLLSTSEADNMQPQPKRCKYKQMTLFQDRKTNSKKQSRIMDFLG